VRFADDLLAIEMTIVTPPFILDFAGAYLDPAPDFPLKFWRNGHRKSKSSLARNGRGLFGF